MIVNVAVFAFRNPGVGEWNRTLTVQLAPGARLAPHVVAEIVKSDAFGPLIAELIGPVAVVQRLVIVMVWAALVPGPIVTKVKAEGETDSLTPVPVSATGEPFTTTLAEMVAFAEAAPGAGGEKTMVIVQLAAAAKVAPQEPPERANGAGTETEIPVAVAPPLLYSVSV